MPIRYLQTMGAVAGIVTPVDVVEVTCAKPGAMEVTASVTVATENGGGD